MRKPTDAEVKNTYELKHAADIAGLIAMYPPKATQKNGDEDLNQTDPEKRGKI